MAPAGIGSRVEGHHAVAAAIAAGRVTHLWVAAGRLRDPQISDLVDRARRSGAEIAIVEDVADVAETDSPQGLVADARPVALVSLEQAVALSTPAALLVLDHLEDPRNVGAIARSTLAAGVPALVVATRRAAPLGATAFKAAAGAFEHLAVVAVSSIADCLRDLRSMGVWLVGLSASGDQSLFDLPLLSEPVAVVVGAEGTGLGRLVADRVDVAASIPLAPDVESLNASVAAALATFEIARVRDRG